MKNNQIETFLKHFKNVLAMIYPSDKQNFNIEHESDKLAKNPAYLILKTR